MMGMPGLSKEVIDEKLEKATQHRLKGNDHFVIIILKILFFSLFSSF